MPLATDNLALVKEILGRMMSTGDVRPLLDALDDDVGFSVAISRDEDPEAAQTTGKDAVLEYFESLGELITFWRVRYACAGTQVVVLAEESYTIQPAGIPVHSAFALVFELHEGLITRLTITDDPPALAGAGGESRCRPWFGLTRRAGTQSSVVNRSS